MADLIDVYQPLAHGQIRLLTFTADDGLSFTMAPYHLDNAPSYIALSYTWGKAAYQKGRQGIVTYSTNLNGHAFEVQQNLHDALRHLGPVAKRRRQLLWADAICIDQANLDEKSRQVPLMRQIYERSERIFAWLGLPFDEDEARLAVKLMKDCNKYLYHKQHDEGIHIDVLSATIDKTSTFFPRNDDDLSRAWRGVADMFQQRYWLRVWIYQEVTTPGVLHFWCGRNYFNDVQLAAACYFAKIFAQFQEFDREFVEDIADGAASSLESARIARQESRGQDFLSIIGNMRGLCCSDDRDRVFAARCLANDVMPGILEPDYSQTVLETYLEVAQCMMIKPFALGLRLFSYVSIPAIESASPFLREAPQPPVPSWVPDWRVRVRCVRLGGLAENLPGGRELFRPYPNSECEVQAHGEILHINALVAAQLEISILSKIWDEVSDDLTTPLSWVQELVGNKQVYDELVASLCQCITADSHCTNADDGLKLRRGSDLTYARLRQLGAKVTTRDELAFHIREPLLIRLTQVSHGRRAALLTCGRFAVLPAAARIGDKFAAFAGGHLLYVIRPISPEAKTYSFVGECYVHSLMDGDFVKICEEAGSGPQMIKLI